MTGIILLKFPIYQYTTDNGFVRPIVGMFQLDYWFKLRNGAVYGTKDIVGLYGT